MERTRFYVNGYRYNLGEILSFEISKHDFDMLYSIQSRSFEGENIIASLESGKANLEDMILVKSITTKPLENETYMFKDTAFKLKAIYKNDPAELIPDFNMKVKPLDPEVKEIHNRQQEWERLKLDNDAVKRIREKLNGTNRPAILTPTGMYSFKLLYNLDSVTEATLDCPDVYCSVSFGFSKHREIDMKYHDLLKAWCNYERFQYAVRFLQERELDQFGLVLEASYGLDDKILEVRIGRKHEIGFKFIKINYTDSNNTNVYVCEPKSSTERMIMDRVLNQLKEFIDPKFEITVEQALEKFK